MDTFHTFIYRSQSMNYQLLVSHHHLLSLRSQQYIHRMFIRLF